MRVFAVIDGEHHPSVARDALDRLAGEHEVCGVLFAGGEEKVAAAALADSVAAYGREVTSGPDPVEALERLAARVPAEAVVDLAGAPVVDGAARSRLASIALHLGLEYLAPGLRLRPPPRERLEFAGPVVAVIGTGKRTGKTALAGHYAALIREAGSEPVVVCMGRGGPPEPQLVRAGERTDVGRLLELARSGRHAASDYLEDAALAGVATVGCRRCGEGPAGEPFDSNVAEGFRLARGEAPDAILIEGSGAAIPPVAADRTVCVTTAERAREEALSHLGPYRLLGASLVVVFAGSPSGRDEVEALRPELARWCRGAALVGCTLEPEPATPIAPEARVALFTTAPPEAARAIAARLADHGIEFRVVSSALARRDELERDVERALDEGCDVFLTELKAAAIEVVAERAERHGVAVALLRNRPVSLPGEPDLDDELIGLFDKARAAAGAARETVGGPGGARAGRPLA